MRENFLERKLDFNGILTKKRVFDKKSSEIVFDNSIPPLTPDQPHRTQNALFRFLM